MASQQIQPYAKYAEDQPKIYKFSFRIFETVGYHLMMINGSNLSGAISYPANQQSHSSETLIFTNTCH